MTSTTSPTERVGRYQLLEPIGIGPSGTVSRAKVFGVAGFERQFAVKRFHAELTATAAMAAMLSAAARAYGSLEHPRIARMSEFGVAQGATFTAVEYVVGIDAMRLIAEARLAGVNLAAGGALALVSQAARAVGYAHGRGLTHLGLAPTNVIITADGDIKITDFGILSATLAQRPIEVPRLANRIPYLAPEQLANEATSAATDVFALGVLAYELVTGTRTFRGDTPQQVASAIMAGPPPEPALPRPIVRVLQRCLARSPFERFPDARALADALDAAVRVAPVPGTRKDVGAQVKETLDRLAALNDGQMSGVVALHVNTGPIRVPPTPGDDDPGAAYALGRADGGPVGLGAGPTIPDLPRQPFTTMPGVAPPPIPVPPGVAEMPAPPPPIAPPGASTLVGVSKPPPTIPTIRPRSAQGPGTGPLSKSASGQGPSTGPLAKPPAIPSRVPPSRSAAEIPVPIDPATPSARIEAGSDGIHTLDPSDLVAVDERHDEMGDAAAAAAAELDAALEKAVLTGSGARRRPAPLDDQKNTRPLLPLELEPLLSEPQARGATGSARATGVPEASDRGITEPHITIEPDDDPESRAATEPRIEDEEDRRATSLRLQPPPGVQSSAATQAIGSFGDLPEPDELDVRSGHTMLGIGSSTDAQPGGPEYPIPVAAPYTGPHPAPSSPDDDGSSGDAGQTGTPGSGLHRWSGDPRKDAAAAVAPPDTATPTAAADSAVRPPRRQLIWILVGMVGAVLVGLTAWQAYERAYHLPAPSVAGGSSSTTGSAGGAGAASATGIVATPIDETGAVARDAATDASAPSAVASIDAASADAARIAAVDAAADATRAATAPVDAPSSPSDAGAVAAKPVPAGTAGDTLAIASSPPGARVFLDGADAGTTPLTLPGSPDRHTIALLLAGHELYNAQVDGHGAFQIALKEVTPTNGPAGIKVLRCKDANRYYVFIDGKPTGQTCPTERIGCEVGAHTVEVYDVVSETRRKWDINVTDTRLSFRVRVE